MRAPRLQKVLAGLEASALCELQSKRHSLRDPMEMILFENVAYLVSDEQHWAAFEALKKAVGLDPARLLTVSDSVLSRIVKPPGHARMLIAKLREVALIAVQEFEGDIRRVLRMSTVVAKRSLMKFPSIGEPGAEKILLFSGTMPILALDSNGVRALLRLGFGKEQKSYKATYKSVQEAAITELGPESNSARLINVHLLLKEHGRNLCRRTNPLCGSCPVSKLCRYYAEQLGSGLRV